MDGTLGPVLMNAELKIYLTAKCGNTGSTSSSRAAFSGIDSDLVEVRKALVARDAQDSNRLHAPLKQAEDACVVDSTGRSPEEVVEEIVGLARLRMA